MDTAEGPEIADDEDDEKSAMQRLQEMTVPQKMSRATKGTREERAILIRDPNKLISVAVLSSPKLTGLGSGSDRQDVQCVRGDPAHHLDTTGTG